MTQQKAYCSGSSFPVAKKGTIRLYSARFCPYAERARLVLQHKNIPHEIINIDLYDKPEWFLDRAPMGKVPVLEVDGEILYESPAVSEYLDDVYSGDKLQPQDPVNKAKDRILLECFGQLTSALYVIRTLKDEDELEVKTNQILKNLQFYEDELVKRGGPYFGGAAVKMIDYFLWPHIERVPGITKMFPKIELSTERFPKLSAWWNVMIQVPAVKKEMFDAETHYETIKMTREGKRTADYGLSV